MCVSALETGTEMLTGLSTLMRSNAKYDSLPVLVDLKIGIGPLHAL